MPHGRFVGLHEAGISFNIGALQRREPPSDLCRHGDILAQKLADGTALRRGFRPNPVLPGRNALTAQLRHRLVG
jgi:hypothetical protein